MKKRRGRRISTRKKEQAITKRGMVRTSKRVP
jgi:hypothetical protein